MSDLIAPHGGNLVDRVATGARRDELGETRLGGDGSRPVAHDEPPAA